MYAITRCFSGHCVSLNCPLLSSLAIYFSSSRLFCHIGRQTRFPVPVLPLAKPSSNHHNIYFPKVGCSPCHPAFKTLHNSPLYPCHTELTLPFSVCLSLPICRSLCDLVPLVPDPPIFQALRLYLRCSIDMTFPIFSVKILLLFIIQLHLFVLFEAHGHLCCLPHHFNLRQLFCPLKLHCLYYPWHIFNTPQFSCLLSSL